MHCDIVHFFADIPWVIGPGVLPGHRTQIGILFPLLESLVPKPRVLQIILHAHLHNFRCAQLLKIIILFTLIRHTMRRFQHYATLPLLVHKCIQNTTFIRISILKLVPVACLRRLDLLQRRVIQPPSILRIITLLFQIKHLIRLNWPGYRFHDFFAFSVGPLLHSRNLFI